MHSAVEASNVSLALIAAAKQNHAKMPRPDPTAAWQLGVVWRLGGPCAGLYLTLEGVTLPCGCTVFAPDNEHTLNLIEGPTGINRPWPVGTYQPLIYDSPYVRLFVDATSPPGTCGTQSAFSGYKLLAEAEHNDDDDTWRISFGWWNAGFNVRYWLFFNATGDGALPLDTPIDNTLNCGDEIPGGLYPIAGRGTGGTGTLHNYE